MAQTGEFFEAVQNGDAEKVEEFLRSDRSLLEAKSPRRGLSAVAVAAYSGKADVLQALLRHGPTLDVHEAALAGDLRRVQELVERDPRLVNGLSMDGFAPLGLAAYLGRPEVVRYLLGKGADPEYKSANTGFTALTGAVANGHEAVVKILLENGAKSDYRYEGGMLTPLHEAISNGRVGIVRLLLEHGADPNARMATGQSALALAEGKAIRPIIELLREHGATA